MIYFLEFVFEALDEAEAATKYYEEIQPGLGLRFREELETVTQAIVSQPLLWRERIGGFRRVNLPGFPFYISYFLRGHSGDAEGRTETMGGVEIGCRRQARRALQTGRSANQILIVDEVLAVGNAELQKKCLGKVKDFANHCRKFFVIELNGVTSRLLRKDCSPYSGKMGTYSRTPRDGWAGIGNLKGSRQSGISRGISNRLGGKVILRFLCSNHCWWKMAVRGGKVFR